MMISWVELRGGGVLPEHKGSVVSTKAQVIGDGHLHIGFDRFVRHVIQVTIGVGCLVVDGWWDKTLLDDLLHIKSTRTKPRSKDMPPPPMKIH